MRIEALAGATGRTGNAAWRGLRNLFHLLGPRDGSPPLASDESFLGTLKARQQHAVALLCERWMREQDAELISAGKPHIFALALFRLGTEGSIPSHRNRVQKLLRLSSEDDRKLLLAVDELLQYEQGELYRKTHVRIQRTYSGLGGGGGGGLGFGTQTAFHGSVFHRNILLLFDWELIYLVGDAASHFITQQAATTSAARRLGCTCASYLSPNPRGETIYPLGPRNPRGVHAYEFGPSAISDPCSWLQTSQGTALRLPRYLWEAETADRRHGGL